MQDGGEVGRKWNSKPVGLGHNGRCHLGGGTGESQS